MHLYLERPALREPADAPELLRATPLHGTTTYIEPTPELLAMFGDDRTGLFEAEHRGDGGWDVRRRADVAANDNVG